MNIMRKNLGVKGVGGWSIACSFVYNLNVTLEYHVRTSMRFYNSQPKFT